MDFTETEDQQSSETVLDMCACVIHVRVSYMCVCHICVCVICVCAHVTFSSSSGRRLSPLLRLSAEAWKVKSAAHLVCGGGST